MINRIKNSFQFKILLIGAIFLANASVSIYGQARRKADGDTEKWRYEIEVMGVGISGTNLIKVWTYSKDPDVAIEQSKKNAIHGIIFRGFAGKEGVTGNSPLADDVNLEVSRADFFDPFFNDGGKYLKFVSLSNDGNVAYQDRLKVGKEYKIGVLVSVRVSELRKELENAGIIRSLKTGF